MKWRQNMKLISSNCLSKNFVEFFFGQEKKRNNNRIWDQPSRLSQKLMNTVPRELKVFEIRSSSMFWHDHQNIFDKGAHCWEKKPRERNLKKKILAMPRGEGSIKKTAWGFLLFNHRSLPLGFQAPTEHNYNQFSRAEHHQRIKLSDFLDFLL